MNWINKIISNKWFQHAAFWTISFALLIHLFAYNNNVEKIDWIYTGLFHLSLIFVVYVNLGWLIPRFLQKKKLGWYLALGVICIFLGAQFNHLTYLYLAGLLFPDYYFTSAFSTLSLMGIMASYFILSTLLHLSKSWVDMQRMERKMLRLEKERQQSELAALHAQIHPHFMMNSLNNLYGLSLASDERLPDLILKLSESMQYLLYKSNKEVVPLKDEINFLNQYIDLEKLRTDYPENITCNWIGVSGEMKTAPLVLLPIVENTFKHGSLSGRKKGFIHISGEANNGSMVLTVENTINQRSNNQEDESSGFGLANLKKRLEMLYPGNYELTTRQSEDVYFTYLKYPLS